MPITILTYTVANLSKAEHGERFTFKDADYTVEQVRPYKNAAGEDRVRVRVSTFCEDCGELFEIDTRRRPKWLPRTCGRNCGHKAAPKAADAPRGNVGPLDVVAKVLPDDPA